MINTTTATRREVWISAGMLGVVAPFMAEVLSSNLTPFKFLIVAWFLIAAYGFPVLLLREWAVRRGVSLGGLLVAGFGYGLLNEGLLAKTLFLNRGVPWDLFDGHLGFGGVNWGWLLVICAYHALFSVVTPILLIDKLRPQTAGQIWLSQRSAFALLAVTALVSLMYFSQKPKTLPLGFWLLWAAIGAGLVFGSLWRRGWEPSFQSMSVRALVWLGSPLLPVLLICSVAFAHGLPFYLFALCWSLVVCFMGRSAMRSGANGMLLLGLGAYVGMSVMNVFVGNPVAKVVGMVAAVVIVAWLRKNEDAFGESPVLTQKVL